MNQIHIQPVCKDKFGYHYQIRPRPSNWPVVFIFSYKNFVLNYLPLSTGILYGYLQRVTIPEAVVIQFVLLMMSSVLLETC